MAPTEQDLFFYQGDSVSSENLERYKPGGFHPIILGDILPAPGTCASDASKQPRYRISQKLGHGAFSTVWLARDFEQERYVSFKVNQGSSKPVESNETKSLEHIRRVDLNRPGRKHVIDLYDAFTIKGPNGFHECLVTEVILPLGDLAQRCPSRQLIKQLFSGFEFLHSEGVCHGDPHSGNLGVAIPGLQDIDENDIADHFAAPEVIPVVPRDRSFPRQSVPIYLTETISLRSLLQNSNSLPPAEKMCLKILDFGRSSWITDIPHDLPGAAPHPFRPPEVHIHMLSDGKIDLPWSKEADIWAIGCIAYEIHVRRQLFSSWGQTPKQLYEAFRLGGPGPERWLRYWDLKTFSESTKDWKQPIPPVLDQEAAWEDRRPRSDPGSEVFLDFLRKMIQTEPTERSQLGQLLKHPFLINVDDQLA